MQRTRFICTARLSESSPWRRLEAKWRSNKSARWIKTDKSRGIWSMPHWKTRLLFQTVVSPLFGLWPQIQVIIDHHNLKILFIQQRFDWLRSIEKVIGFSIAISSSTASSEWVSFLKSESARTFPQFRNTFPLAAVGSRRQILIMMQ